MEAKIVILTAEYSKKFLVLDCSLEELKEFCTVHGSVVLKATDTIIPLITRRDFVHLALRGLTTSLLS